MLDVYQHIVGAPSVQSCCTLSKSASLRVFVYGRYCKTMTCLRVVVGIGLVSTSPTFIGSSASHPLLGAGVIHKTPIEIFKTTAIKN